MIESHLHPLSGVAETSLCGILGVSRNRLRDLRQKNLQYGADWNLVKKRVVYHGRGVEKIRVILLLPPEKTAPPGSSAHPEAVPSLPEPETLLVLKPTLANKRMILAYRPGTDPSLLQNQIRVRVKDSKNFIRFVNGKPMELKARRIVGAAPDFYELATPCPKGRGRW